MSAIDEPNVEAEDCPTCGGPIHTCLWCGYETFSAVVMDEHECEPPDVVDYQRSLSRVRTHKPPRDSL